MSPTLVALVGPKTSAMTVERRDLLDVARRPDESTICRCSRDAGGGE